MLVFLIYMLICSVVIFFSYKIIAEKLELNETEKEIKLIVFLISCIIGLLWPFGIFILISYFLINFFVDKL